MECSTAITNTSCHVSRMDGESNEDTYGRFGMSEAAVGMDCRVVEWVKRSTLRWFGSLCELGLSRSFGNCSSLKVWELASRDEESVGTTNV